MPAIAPLAAPLADMLDTSEQPQQVSFLGTMARTADKAALALAQKMEMQRASPEEIWRNTGWFRSADTKWRFEIPDTGSKFFENPKKNTALEWTRLPMRDVYNHPALFEAHPELGDIPFGARKMGGTAQAAFTPPPRGPMIDVNSRLSMKDMRSALMHELQHGVQGIENFAKGGNPRLPVTSPMETALPLPSVAQEAGVFGPIHERQYGRYLSHRGSSMPFLSQEQYLRQAGEVEARNVQNRLLMTPQQLREIPPWITQSIPNEYQFVNFNLPGPARYIDDSLLRTRY